jgi:hypothetical protein
MDQLVSNSSDLFCSRAEDQRNVAGGSQEDVQLHQTSAAAIARHCDMMDQSANE